MKNNMIIEVGFVPGTEITEAIKEAKIKADQFDVALITFNFNGKKIMVSKKSDVNSLVNEYLENIRSSKMV